MTDALNRWPVETVYQGRERVGEIFEDAGVVTAETADGRPLGSFPSRRAAAVAILAVASSTDGDR